MLDLREKQCLFTRHVLLLALLPVMIGLAACGSSTTSSQSSDISGMSADKFETLALADQVAYAAPILDANAGACQSKVLAADNDNTDSLPKNFLSISKDDYSGAEIEGRYAIDLCTAASQSDSQQGRKLLDAFKDVKLNMVTSDDDLVKNHGPLSEIKAEISPDMKTYKVSGTVRGHTYTDGRAVSLCSGCYDLFDFYQTPQGSTWRFINRFVGVTSDDAPDITG